MAKRKRARTMPKDLPPAGSFVRRPSRRIAYSKTGPDGYLHHYNHKHEYLGRSHQLSKEDVLALRRRPNKEGT